MHKLLCHIFSPHQVWLKPKNFNPNPLSGGLMLWVCCRAKQFLGVVILREIRGFFYIFLDFYLSWGVLILCSSFFEYSVWYHIVLNLLFIWRFDTPTFNKCIKKEKLDCFYKKKCAWKVNFNADQELMWIVSNRQQLIIWYWWKSQCVSDVGAHHLIDDSCEKNM